MVHYQKKESRILYLHDYDKCLRCKLAREAKTKMNLPRKKKIFTRDFIPLLHPNILRRPRQIFGTNFEFSEAYDPMNPIKNILLKRKNLNDSSFKPAKTINCPGSKAGRGNLSDIHPQSVKRILFDSSKKECKPLKSILKPAKEKPALETSSSLNSVKNIDGTKVPGKGTLKRKRWFLDKLNDKNDNYEDDLFENQKFGHFQSLLEDETDSSEKYEDLKTPVFPFSISPRESTPSPTYRDCYSPTQLSIFRKGAEEYQYRKKKRKKCLPDNKEEGPHSNPHSREEDVKRRLQEVARILSDQHRQNEEASDSEDDQYFSDVLDNLCTVNL